MEERARTIKSNYSTAIIVVLSVLIPLVVAILFYMPKPDVEVGFNIKTLPAFHAMINSAASLLLITGFYFIKKKNWKAHKISMLSATGLSILFLLSYVTYHSLSEPTVFGGTGVVKSIYYFVLITHIILAAAIVPLVLLTLYRALTDQLHKHKKIARWAFPLWLYVTITGVVVYFMIAPYY